jgi:hypothetical protein
VSSPAVAASEPAVEAPAAPSAPAEGAEVPADLAGLPDDTQVEIEDPATKQVVKLSLKDLKAGYRHAKVSDQRFTEADKALKKAQSLESQVNGALLAAKKDGGRSVIDWVAKEAGKDPLDVLAEQLEKATDPKVIDKLAALLEKKLQEAETEAKKSPELKELEQIRKERDELKAAVEAQKDVQVENQMFESVKATLAEAGLKPSPLNAIQVLELLVEAKSMTPPIELTPKEAALLLREQTRSNAEMLFKPPDPAVKAKAPANGASAQGAVDAAKRAMKEAGPRVTVVKRGQKKAGKDDSDGEEPKSFLESIMEHAYRQKR